MPNVVADEIELVFDLRVTPALKDEVAEMLKQWSVECDVTLEYINVSVIFDINCSVCVPAATRLSTASY